MTVCQSVVRLATAQDEPSLIDLLKEMHGEVGMFPFSEQRLLELVRPVLRQNGIKPPTPTIIGVIGSPDDLQASVCVMAARVYYSDECHLGDCWNYVRRDCRKSDHAKAMIDFGKSCANAMGLKFMSGVVSTVRTEAKMRLYRRRFGAAIGGYFLYSPEVV